MKTAFLVSFFLISFNTGIQAADTIKIAVFYSQLKTNVANYVSSEDMRGAIIAVNEINKNGGVLGKKLEIIEVRAPNIIYSVASAEELVKENKITAVVGSNISKMTLAIAPVFQKAGIPMITPISTNPKITTIGNYIFRACFTDPFQGEVMAKFAAKNLKAKSAAIFTKTDSLFSLGLAKEFRTAFLKYGKVVFDGKYYSTDADFSQILKQAIGHRPDIIFVPGHGKDVGLILKQADLLNINTTFLGGDGWGKGALGVAGAKAAEGNFFANHWHIKTESKKNKKFVEEYFELFSGDKIAASAALAYDAIMIIKNAIENAKSTDHVAVRDEIAKTTNFEGITGNFTFDETGDPINKQAVILGYKDGGIVYVDTVKP